MGSSGAEATADSRAAEAGRWKRFRLWAIVALLAGLGCAAGAAVAARAVANSDAAKSREAFRQSSAEIASTLQLALQRERDLVVTAEGFFLGDPGASTARFVAWSTSVQALKRFPELESWGEIALVPASGLQAFAAKFVAGDQTGRGSLFHPIPSGSRPYYCLVSALQHRPSDVALPEGVDYCRESSLILTRASGLTTTTAVNLGQGIVMALNSPFYRGGGVPATAAARRAAFVGWIGVSFNPNVALAAALSGHPGTAVALRFHAVPAGTAFVASSAVFRSGTPRANAATTTLKLNDGWTVQTYGAAVSAGVLDNGTAMGLLVPGLLLSVLLAVLVFVLGTSRGLALRLVAERTAELRHQALHDPLTGLPNRTLTLDRMHQMLARSRRSGNSGAALFVDLDEFKNVNDTLGHAAGDRLLVATARRLHDALRDCDTIGRMGGDEFVVVIDGGEHAAEPEVVADRLLEAMREPFELEGVGTSLIVNTSVGIAAGDRASAGELLRDADIALYQAKAEGKNRRHTFNRNLQAVTGKRIELEFDLRSALEGEQFRLVYQPMYRLADLQIVGVEALLRWQHPREGMIGPDRFIPILERTGQIREVGCWVLHEACRQMAVWHSRGDQISISVNVSGVQLDDEAIVEQVGRELDLSGLDARSLILEVTETALMRNATATARRLRAVRKLGVRIAVDDFGTGYSSLSYIQHLPVDSLKIDRSFTSAITTSPESRALVATVVKLAKDLRLTTLAEGVETSEQLDQLRGQRVDEIQGFLLSRPLDAHTLEAGILAPARAVLPAAQRP